MFESCMILFYRDTNVWDNLKSKPHHPIVCVGNNDKVVGFYPPNGVVPAGKMSSYFAPFCYVSN